MAGKYTAETQPYKPGKGSGLVTTPKASYTPNGGPAPTATAAAYGKSGGRSSSQGGTVPTLVIGGSSEVAPLPAMPGTLVIGEDKNVSTPVTG